MTANDKLTVAEIDIAIDLIKIGFNHMQNTKKYDYRDMLNIANSCIQIERKLKLLKE